MELILAVVRFLLWVFAMLVLARIVLDLIQSFSPQWRPRGFMVLVAEAVYTPTDPPLRALRKVIPLIPIGGVRLDVCPMVLLILLSLVSSLLVV